MTLMDQIHHLEEVAAGQVNFDLRDESIADVVALAVEAGTPLAHEHEASIVVEPIDPGITVYVDPGRMVQALTNLLSNAAKFSPVGGEIHVGAELRDGSVRIHVRDQGEGIPEEFRSRIFGRFAQADTETARRKGGAGLGLRITRQLVERMHGSVGFTSLPGEGATFWLEFPVVARRGAMRTG
jgi:signal transduction histidine kinase